MSVINIIESIVAIIGTSLLTLVLSIAGLLPTARLFKLRRGPIRLIHLLSFQLVVALIYAYVTSFLPQSMDGNHLALIVGMSLVAAFWCQVIARWTHEVQNPIDVLIYLTSTVLFAFLCPMMIVLNGYPLLQRVHPTMSAAPMFFVFVVHLALYCLVFWTTSWFISLPKHPEVGEPSDAPKDRTSRFDNGESTAGPR